MRLKNRPTKKKIVSEGKYRYARPGTFKLTPKQLKKALQIYFQPGNIVDGYVGKDKVLDFQMTDLANWIVKVIHVDDHGGVITGERERVHHTMPAMGDLAEALANAEGVNISVFKK
jgi:hypothetical protein